jgi:hypothetical protein
MNRPSWRSLVVSSHARSLCPRSANGIVHLAKRGVTSALEYARQLDGEAMQFGLFGSATARRGGPEFDSSEGFRDFIDDNVEAEALGLHNTIVVEHHFTGYG